MRPQFLLAALTALASLASASCYSPGDGQAPPLDQLYFPTGLALDTSALNAAGEPRYLYVASSDFDLQYRSSGLISFDLDKIAAAVPHPCASHSDCGEDSDDSVRCDMARNTQEAQVVPNLPAYYVPSYVCVPSDAVQPCGDGGEQSAADRLLYPGRCKPFDQHPFIRSAVGIGAFATNVIFAKDPDSPKSRLFLPVRGDATLHWIDLNDGELQCDQASTSDNSCGESHRAGRNPSDNNDNLSQPSEPFGIAISEDGKYIGMTNQTAGSVSLYTHDWNSDVGPQLVSIAGGLPAAPVAIAAVPPVLDVTDPGAPAPGFLVAYRNAAQIDLLRVRNDDADGHPEGNYSRYTFAYAGSAPIAVNSRGFDSRDIVIDDSERKAGCDPTKLTPAEYLECLRVGPQPAVYVANRAPASLVVGSLAADFSYASGSSDLPAFTHSIPLTTGPSRLARGNVRVPAPDSTPGPRDEHGKRYDLEPRVFIVCFDSTRIFVYDPKRDVIDTIIDTGRGPYALAVDEARGLAYVGFFTDSYVGVVSLDRRFRQTYGAVIANIGTPTPPRSSK